MTTVGAHPMGRTLLALQELSIHSAQLSFSSVSDFCNNTVLPWLSSMVSGPAVLALPRNLLEMHTLFLETIFQN